MMRFVRHSTKSEWGLGVVATADASNLDVLFEGVGYKKLAKSTPVLIHIADGGVPADHALRKREDWSKIERNGMRASAGRELPKRLDGLIKEFVALFPGGLRSSECDAAERECKVVASAYARRELDPGVLDGLLERGGHEQILMRARRSLSKANLALCDDLRKFGDIPASAAKDVAEHIVRLVKAGGQTPAALADLAAVLTPHGAAKWPIVSLLPFLLDPEHWPFVKPTFIERVSEATGIDVEYDPLPNARTYELVRDLYQHVSVTLKERAFAPRDFIDVHTFLWVASGLAREASDERTRTGGVPAW